MSFDLPRYIVPISIVKPMRYQTCSPLPPILRNICITNEIATFPIPAQCLDHTSDNIRKKKRHGSRTHLPKTDFPHHGAFYFWSSRDAKIQTQWFPLFSCVGDTIYVPFVPSPVVLSGKCLIAKRNVCAAKSFEAVLSTLSRSLPTCQTLRVCGQRASGSRD